MKSIDDALDWARSVQLFAPISDHHRRAVSQLWPLLEPLGVQTALDVGTGQPPGLVVGMLKEHGVRAFGLDSQPGSDYTGDMHDLPFASNTFDLVIARHSLEHVLIPLVCLREMARVSKGWLLVVVPVDSHKALDWPDHLNVYGRGGWETLFRHVGLKVKEFVVGDHTEEHAVASGAWKDEEWRWLLEKEG